jgi:hypothetical protein
MLPYEVSLGVLANCTDLEFRLEQLVLLLAELQRSQVAAMLLCARARRSTVQQMAVSGA